MLDYKSHLYAILTIIGFVVVASIPPLLANKFPLLLKYFPIVSAGLFVYFLLYAIISMLREK